MKPPPLVRLLVCLVNVSAAALLEGIYIESRFRRSCRIGGSRRPPGDSGER